MGLVVDLTMDQWVERPNLRNRSKTWGHNDVDLFDFFFLSVSLSLSLCLYVKILCDVVCNGIYVVVDY